jgi:GTPase Era involved in 16S rRNA processing
VSIIGSQSSGKSTLLNEIFHTSFEVLQRRVKGQTTKGIWFSVDPAQHMFIFDVEGSDANERK